MGKGLKNYLKDKPTEEHFLEIRGKEEELLSPHLARILGSFQRIKKQEKVSFDFRMGEYSRDHF